MSKPVTKIAVIVTMAWGLLLAGGSAMGATVTLTGATVAFEFDTDINAAALAAWGLPQVQGDVIRFAPPAHRVAATDGGTANHSLEFVFDRVYSLSGLAVGEIGFVTFGDYEIIGGGQLHADWTLAAVRNAGGAGEASDTLSLEFSGASGGLKTWQVSGSISPAAVFTESANDLRLTISAILSADTSTAGQSAFLQSKLGFVPVTAVPLPAASWLIVSGLLVAGLRLRRRAA